MSGVPAVVFPVGRTRALAGVLATLAAGGWVLLALGLLWPAPPLWSARAALALMLAALAATAGCWHFWQRQTARQLRWDGECWWLADAGREHEGAPPEVRLDAQRWMLLWFRPLPGRRGCWLWAQASADAPRWHLLRCALYSPVTSTAPGDAPAVDVERA